jgi:hypothetical protein
MTYITRTGMVLLLLTCLVFSTSATGKPANSAAKPGPVPEPTPPASLLSNTLFWSSTGAATGNEYAKGVGFAGDMNSDTSEDIIIGATGVNSGAGQITIYAGNSGSVISSIDGEGAGDRFGRRVDSAGDFNGDGFADIVVGAHHWGPNDEGKVYVYAGPNPTSASLLFSVTGSSTSALGDDLAGRFDFNNDGYDDIIVGAPFDSTAASFAGKATVYGGPSGSVLFSVNGAANEQLGIGARKLGDVNGDGNDDVIVGTFKNGIGRAAVYAGPSGTLLYSKNGETSGDRFGSSVNDAGDFNGDGFADFAVSAVAYSSSKGKVYIYSGADGALLFSAVGQGSGDVFGHAVVPLNDVNGDGIGDIAVSARDYGSAGKRWGRIYIYAGSTGALLETITGTVNNSGFGSNLAGGPDFSLNGLSDLLVGAHQFSSSKGAAYLYSF